MDIFQNLLVGLQVAIEPTNLLYCFIGVVFGIFIGALPGLGPSAGIALLLPMTFGMNSVNGIIMLCGIYYGSMYGGSITSILINVPGDSSAVATTFDGYPLAKKGRAGAALGMAAFASIIGGTLSVIVLTFLAPAIANWALKFGPPEYFSLMVLGLMTVSGMTGKTRSKGYISALAGLFFGVIGLDLIQAVPRFTFGTWELYDGLDFVTAALGLFGIAEILCADYDLTELKVEKKDVSFKRILPTREDWKHSLPFIGSGTAIGLFIGMLPGAGAAIAALISYSFAMKVSKRGDQFGTGVIEGVAAPESANNAASSGALIPMLTLGIPGSAATALMLGALMMFGVTPGPLMFQNNIEFVWGLIASMYIGNVILAILSTACVVWFIKILTIPSMILNSIVMAFILVGAYSLNGHMFDVGTTIFFGFLGFFMKKYNYPPAPMVLALVLGRLAENALRQSMTISFGNPLIFFTRPISGTIMLIVLIFLLHPYLMKLVRLSKQKG
jgi:putative tricarboxylic transport membrane protein